MLKQIFAIVGYTNWGKSNTLYELFGKRQFFPLKSPIRTKRFDHLKFTVINASNEDRITREYLDRLKTVLKTHWDDDPIFFITVSLIFDNGKHDIKPVFDYLNTLSDFEVNYIVLDNGWFTKNSLSSKDISLMNDYVDSETIHHFPVAINESKAAFSERTIQVAEKIRELLM
jgi:hypothetical protein